MLNLYVELDFFLFMLKKNGGILMVDMIFLKFEYDRYINNYNEILYLL